MLSAISCLAQSARQQASYSDRSSQRFNLAQENESTLGQRLCILTREAWSNVIERVQGLSLQGKSSDFGGDEAFFVQANSLENQDFEKPSKS